MVYGSCLGEDFQSRILRRLRKITLDSPAGKTTVTAEEQEANKLDWTGTFVMAPSTLRLIYDSTSEDMIDGEVSPLRSWAVDVTALRLDMRQLRRFFTNDLPNGYVSEVYQRKSQQEAKERSDLSAELEDLRAQVENLRGQLQRRAAAHERTRRELFDQAQARLEECLKAGCTPNVHRSCKLHEHRARFAMVP